MKKTIYRILLGIMATLALSAAVTFYVLGRQHHSSLECKGLNVTIKDSVENRFVSKEDVERIIKSDFGQVGEKLAGSLDLTEIEKLVTSKSAVLRCEAYITPDGMLNLDISQRTPAVRFQTASNGWYADSDGYIFPLQRSYTSMVPVVDGDFPIKPERGYKGKIEDEAGKKWLENIINLVEYMEKSGWIDRITQIHVERGGEITLVPVSGDERFRFGQPEKFPEKFGKMEKYYRMILPRDRKYTVVDLRYRDQIICSK